MVTLATYVHDWSPFLVQLGDGFGLRWYGLAYALGFLIAYQVMKRLSRAGFTPIPEQRVADAMLMLIAGVIVGGRVGYVLIYEPKLLAEFSSSFPFWGALALNKGGMAYHGGMVGVMLAGWWVSRGFKDEQGLRSGACPWRHVMDLLALACTAGLGLGRLANFVNGELLGKVVAQPGQPAPWWAVKFPQELVSGHMDVTRNAEQAAALDKLLMTYAPEQATWDGAVFRVIELLQHGGETGRRISQGLEPLISARHPSQLYQAFFEGVLVTAVLWFVARRPRLPGVIGCWFLISYGLLRIAAEFFRLPDTQFANGRPLGLSRGQWLSAAMVGAGGLVLAWVVNRGGEKMGGWCKGGARGEVNPRATGGPG
ncbi:MAG: prolipoprotein diacylglyceryl transferase [Phycisphaerales bacterium]